MSPPVPHVLIVEARFYDDLADELARGAIEEIEQQGGTYDRAEVPGVLEVPAAVAYAAAAGRNGGTVYDGYVALGCVIRGETTHYDIVSTQSARALMDLAVRECLALGNGIQTVENAEQAWARARVTEKNKGGGAAAACLEMIALYQKMDAGR